jgi:hypothetical protein
MDKGIEVEVAGSTCEPVIGFMNRLPVMTDGGFC